MRKKKVLIHSNFCKAFTGFGKHKKNILKYLQKTGKYEIIEAANGRPVGDPTLEGLPWKCYGCVPANYEQLDPNNKKLAGYGQLEIENIVKETKPDVYIGIEDIWGFSEMPKQPWWSKINTMIWTTLDSLPILQQAIDFAPKVKHYYVWASFAEKAMRELGYDHIKTLRGSIETSKFFKLEETKRAELRKAHGIAENDFIVGFVFRNQLRKSVPNLLDGFKLLKEEVPNAKLLLHTHWQEGWDIPRLIEEKNINPADILTTYYCKACKNYTVKPFSGEGQNCNRCGSQRSLGTSNISYGVSDDQLNEIYNLMDVYCHPFTSGGQEIPIQEAKLTELISLVTNYSCGEDNCSPESGGLSLEWNEYREPGTQFIKASTSPHSIFEQLLKVYKMDKEERKALGEKSRQWVLDNFSIEVIGKKLEEIIDGMPLIEDFNFERVEFNEKAPMPDKEDIDKFIITLYKEILHDDVDKNTSGFKTWKKKISVGEVSLEGLHNHFINVAIENNTKNKSQRSFESLFTKEDEGKRVAVVIPRDATDVLLINSLIKKLKKKHNGHNIYIFTEPQYFEYIEDNPDVYKCYPYAENIDSPLILEGHGKHLGFFEAAYLAHATTQKTPCFIHNGK